MLLLECRALVHSSLKSQITKYAHALLPATSALLSGNRLMIDESRQTLATGSLSPVIILATTTIQTASLKPVVFHAGSAPSAA